MSYYTRWGLVIGSPYFQQYLKSSYGKGIADLQLLHKSPAFSRHGFSCLLCGVGNKETARTFIQFVLGKNSKSRIVIIDFGSEQIRHVKQLVKGHFSNEHIVVRQMDALSLRQWLPKNSLDWIETDGFLEFFPKELLRQLLDIWHFLLKPDGFITIREPASDSFWGSLIDALRIQVAKWWLGIDIYQHTLKDLEQVFREKKFRFVTFPTRIPTLQRFTLVKE